MSKDIRIEEAEVLVVGAGPAGLTAAIALARAGIEVLVVERREELSSLPRATLVSLRSMEIFRGWGLEDEIEREGVDVEWEGWECETLAAASSGRPFLTGVPSTEQSSVLSPVTPVCVGQDRLETVLFSHLRSLPAACTRLGCELVDVESDGDGIHARLRDADGRGFEVRASHLIGADGAHSRTR